MVPDWSQHLKAVCESSRVLPVFAFLCGSRGWGLSDDKSDFDVRFLFVPADDDDERNVETISVVRDKVLELQGWDVRKALKLYRSNNATVTEWLRSECVYCCDPVLLRAWQAAICGGENCGSFVPHYLGLVKSERKRSLGGRRDVVLAEYLHVARPALVLHALLRNNCFPPVRFDDLVAEPSLPEPVRAYLAALAERKRSGLLRPGEEGPHSRAVDEWLDGLEQQGAAAARVSPWSERHLAVLRSLAGRSRIAAHPRVREVRVCSVQLSRYRDSFGRSYGELLFELLSQANAASCSGIRLLGNYSLSCGEGASDCAVCV